MYDDALLRKKLIAAARANPPGDQVPYAFERRITALITGRPATDRMALWVRGFWHAALSCVIITLLLGLWAFFTPPASGDTEDFSQNFETTLLASVDQGDFAQ